MCLRNQKVIKLRENWIAAPAEIPVKFWRTDQSSDYDPTHGFLYQVLVDHLPVELILKTS